MITVSVLLGSAMCLAMATAALATTYYVDSRDGNDSNRGDSADSPWRSLDRVNEFTFRPGDRLLFRNGGVWKGQLWPKGSGEEGAPIVVGCYGEGGKRPLIACEGRAFEAVRLYNQEWWEISDLEVTNFSAEGRAPRAGVRVLAEDSGRVSHIYLRGLEVHDVNGAFHEGRDGGKCNAGILFDVVGSRTPTWYDDVLIEGCHIYRCDRSGIKTWSDWHRWVKQGWAPSTRVVVRGNVLDDIGGDGIVVGIAAAPLIEHNVASRCNARAGDYNVAIWVWETDDAVIQFNEAYLTRTTKDGQGFDIDGLTKRTIVQYNYSHDNEGGFILLCETGDRNPLRTNDGSVVRYNISQNDRARIFQIGGKVTNASIYNNTIYIGEGHGDPLVVWHNQDKVWPRGIRYANNIFYNLGTGGYDLGRSEEVVFDHNCFFGRHPESEPEDEHKLTCDPKLVNPGSGGVGRDTADGYQLQADSPCIDTGALIPDHGGRDYWGHPVPSGVAPDRGAHEFQREESGG